MWNRGIEFTYSRIFTGKVRGTIPRQNNLF